MKNIYSKSQRSVTFQDQVNNYSSQNNLPKRNLESVKKLINMTNKLPGIRTFAKRSALVDKINEARWNNKCFSVSDMNKQIYRDFKISFENIKSAKINF